MSVNQRTGDLTVPPYGELRFDITEVIKRQRHPLNQP
jgi:hypothetical protein